METLYITQNKCTVKREGGHLKIMRSGEVLSSVPLISVKTIVVFDSVSITAPAMDLLMKNGIDIIYQSMWGKVKGRVFAMNGGGAILRLAQHSAFLDNISQMRQRCRYQSFKRYAVFAAGAGGFLPTFNTLPKAKYGTYLVKSP